MQPSRVFQVALATSLLLCQAAEARLTRLEISKREVVADGQAFGSAGAYEKLSGRAWFEVDPKAERNAAVFDVDRAPVNKEGRVEVQQDERAETPPPPPPPPPPPEAETAF